MNFRTKAASAAALATLAVGAVLTSAAPANADVIGCSPGHVCTFKSGTLFDVRDTWYYYGTYNLSNYKGKYDVCNEQTGGAVVRLYSKSNAQGTVLKTIKGADPHVGNCANGFDMTPVYSIKLSKS